MTVGNREPVFGYTVGAARDLDALCAERGAENLSALIGVSGQAQRDAMCGVILILSRWGEKAAAAENPDFDPQPLTRDELDLLPVADFTELFGEALAAIERDGRRSVRTEDAEAQKKTDAPGPLS